MHQLPSLQANAISLTRGPLARFGAAILRHERMAWAVVVVGMLLYYGALLTGFQFDLFRPIEHGLTFNSMLASLFHGRFDVDPSIVADEGFRRDGRVYAYWGIAGALLRLPLLAVKGGLDIDVTVLSCLVAACLGGWLKFATAMSIRRRMESGAIVDAVFCLLILYIVFGPTVAYLHPTIYQEVVSWSVAFAAGFVLCAVSGLTQRTFTPALLVWMACLAGLTLLMRVSTGMGLYAALGLLLAVLFATAAVPSALAGSRGVVRGFWRHLGSSGALVPMAILGGFAVLAGIVNIGRWGKATTFADYGAYITYAMYPWRTAPLEAYGLFNLVRIPFAVLYYVVPVWIFPGPDGAPLLTSIRHRLFDLVELPPGSFLLTELFSLALIVLLVVAWRRGALAVSMSIGQLLALAAGLAVPGALMLAAINLAHRFRMEFYPLFDLLAFAGFYASLTGGARRVIGAGAVPWLVGATAISIVSAHVVLVCYKMQMFGIVDRYLGSGILRTYYWGGVSLLRQAGILQ